MATKINQKEYLKKYLNSGKDTEKKKKKKKRAKVIVGQSIRIIDDDLHDSEHQHKNENELDAFVTGEDAPQVVGVIDDRPPELIAVEDFRNNSKWRGFGDDETDVTPSIKKGSNKPSQDDNDQSPVRQKRQTTPDLSPFRRAERSPDLSPQRRNERKPDLSVSRSRKRRSIDESPPRRSTRTPDTSPPRRRRQSQDLSPLRKRKQSSRDSSYRSRDLSPPRSRKRPSRDRSSPRRTKHQGQKGADASPQRRGVTEKLEKTLDGKRAGLQNATDLRVENQRAREREDRMFSKIPASLMGRGAEAIKRDRKTGKRRDYEAEAEVERAKEAKAQALKATYDRWGAGLKQVEDRQAQLDFEKHQMSKPLARYSDDADLEQMLKDRDRIGDPMLAYIKNKQREEKLEAGVPQVPIYQGQFPDNRYNIRPGYRWDGVDRSNGYERKWFEMISKRQAVQEEAYRYSTEDM